MKKLALSAAVIISFILYGLHQRNEDANLPVIAPNGVAVASESPTPGIESPTPSDSPTPAPESTTTSTPTSAGSTATPTATPKPTPKPMPTPSGKYKNGTYTGSVADAYYGNVQVQVTITSGKIATVTFLQYPNDRSTSVRINTQAMPYLQQEAIQAQSAQVNGVSGASDTSQAFKESLSAALSQAS